LKNQSRNRIVGALVVALALLSSMFAQQAAAKPAATRTVIRAARLLDVKTGKTSSNQAIVIEGDTIVSVGAYKPAAGDLDAARSALRREVREDHAGGGLHHHP
jgi:hypothetical protein